MLFDLRSGRRRRVVQVVFGGLAVLFAVGFVGFGVGSESGGGGIIDSLVGGGGGSNDDPFKDDIAAAEKRVEADPRNPKALLELVTLNFQRGNSRLDADPNTGAPILTADASEAFNKAADAWAAYLKLKPAKPNSSAAIQIAQVYFLLAQNAGSSASARQNIADAAEAQAIVTAATPSAANYRTLAFYLYFAGRAAAADDAAAQALAKASGAERSQFKAELRQAELGALRLAKQIEQERKGAAAAPNPLESPGGLGG